MSVSSVRHTQGSLSAHSHICMCVHQCACYKFLHTRSLTYPLKHTYAHIHAHKVEQLSWSHNQTEESCWGTLNRKECSLLS